MRNLIRAELIGLRTLRSTYAVIAGVILAAVGITLADFGDANGTVLDNYSTMREGLLTAVGVLGAAMLAVFAANRTGGEFRHQTIGQRALAAPQRRRIVATKAITYGGLAAVITAVALAIALPAAKAMATSKGVSFDPTMGQVGGMFAEVMIASSLFAMLGVAVAFITRSQTAAILVVLGAFIVEQLLGGIIGPIGDYMPYSLLDSTLDAGSLAPATGALVLAGLMAAVTAVALRLFRARDVH